MRKLLLITIFVFSTFLCKGQQGYSGVTFDYNSGIGERYTYGLGLHMEMRCTRTKNLYFNWHYSLGSNTHGEMYGHGGLSLLLYRYDDWWDNVHSWDELVGTIIAPIMIPNGVTYYLPQKSKACKDHRIRMGIYCNPIAMDYWNMKPRKVTSWTIESGCKLLWEINDNRVLYFAGGVSFTNNMRPAARGTGYGNEELISIQLGMLGVMD
jgi:hypothetical protein